MSKKWGKIVFCRKIIKKTIKKFKSTIDKIINMDLRKKQILFLQYITPLLTLETSKKVLKEDKEIERAKVIEIEELIKRIERIERALRLGGKEGVRKRRMKEKIILLLQENKRLSSYQLSKLIGLSRTRCNEYLKELAREGLAEGVIIGRKKFYRLVKR